MPVANFVTKHEDTRPYVPLPVGESLNYYTGETQMIFDVVETRYELGELPDPLPENLAQLHPNPKAIMDVSDPESPALDHWLLYTVVEKEVFRPRGGVVTRSPQPGGLPPGTMIIIVRATEDMLNGLHIALFGENAAWGMYPNTDSIMEDAE